MFINWNSISDLGPPHFWRHPTHGLATNEVFVNSYYYLLSLIFIIIIYYYSFLFLIYYYYYFYYFHYYLQYQFHFVVKQLMSKGQKITENGTKEMKKNVSLLIRKGLNVNKKIHCKVLAFDFEVCKIWNFYFRLFILILYAI